MGGRPMTTAKWWIHKTIRLCPEMRDHLREMSVRMGKSQQAVLRAALEEYWMDFKGWYMTLEDLKKAKKE